MNELITFIEDNLTRKRLEKISTAAIDAYKNEDDVILNAYAEALNVDGNSRNRKKLFYSVIKKLHPDRLPVLLNEFEEAKKSSDIQSLKRIRQLLEVRIYASSVKSERFDYEHHETYAPEYDYEQDYDSDSDFFDEAGDFIAAVKSAVFGNHDFPIDQSDLGQIDGSLDVGAFGLEDLDGIEYCRNVRVLNISVNNVTNIHDLQFLSQLEELYAADNVINNIEPLAELDNLEIADLSGNDIEDIAPLLNMSGLKFVNIRNNPVRDRTVIEKLEAAGVIVLR